MLTDTVMLVVLMVLAVAAAAAAVAAAVAAVAALRRSRSPVAVGVRIPSGTPVRMSRHADRSPGPDAAGPGPDPRRIAVGDMVDVRGQSFSVRGTAWFTDGAWSWSEHFLDDARGRRCRLSVARAPDPDPELVLWTAVEPAVIPPGAPVVEFAGRRYSSAGSGRARFTTTGTTGLEPDGAIRYHDYRAPDGARLSFESGDRPRTGGPGAGGWEVATGEPLRRAEVAIYPATG